MLIDQVCPAQVVGLQVIDAVLGSTTAAVLQSFHVSLFGASQGQDAYMVELAEDGW